MERDKEWRAVLRLVGVAVADKAVQAHIRASNAPWEKPPGNAAEHRIMAETLDSVAAAIIEVLGEEDS